MALSQKFVVEGDFRVKIKTLADHFIIIKFNSVNDTAYIAFDIETLNEYV